MSHDREFTTEPVAAKLHDCSTCGCVIWSREHYRKITTPPGHMYLSNEGWAVYRECRICAAKRGKPIGAVGAA